MCYEIAYTVLLQCADSFVFNVDLLTTPNTDGMLRKFGKHIHTVGFVLLYVANTIETNRKLLAYSSTKEL